jgi:hypothetical protein
VLIRSACHGPRSAHEGRRGDWGKRGFGHHAGASRLIRKANWWTDLPHTKKTLIWTKARPTAAIVESLQKQNEFTGAALGQKSVTKGIGFQTAVGSTQSP